MESEAVKEIIDHGHHVFKALELNTAPVSDGLLQILARRPHAPNSECKLNSAVRLITRFYGSLESTGRICTAFE